MEKTLELAVNGSSSFMLKPYLFIRAARNDEIMREHATFGYDGKYFLKIKNKMAVIADKIISCHERYVMLSTTKLMEEVKFVIGFSGRAVIPSVFLIWFVIISRDAAVM